MKKTFPVSTIFVLSQMPSLMVQPVRAKTVDCGDGTLSIGAGLLSQDVLVTFGTVSGCIGAEP
jgi:hypothetical protein